ncbi:Sec1 family protein [Babesia bovis T2Bo]|uniref:Syntaxin binding protein, putative n=1 Tax=Babesia bovis TaxID=5865 RepID=A7AW75_BABBO|nr:Sec1 family protein [Babesia bovis T2Bo]EDO05303.1 Sec1 family protein [Babesia bovis T2Bo]|eukprot:XP_001608871.1 syntaxin binding protein [Babesia bovis T2Bo]
MSLKVKAKERLIWAIRQVVVPYGRVMLLVDNRSLRIVSACCSVSDLLDEGVDLVELIDKKRQPMRSKTALYLLSDDYQSVSYFVKDFTPGKELYKAAYLMFNGHMEDDRALRQIAEKVDMKRILACMELHLNFLPYENRLFHGNLGFTILDLYPSHHGNIIHSIASRIASVCSTMGALPQIRYHAAPNGLPELVAKATQKLINCTTPEDTPATDDLLLIVDRSYDAIAMHIHEYTYQALIYDVLKIPCCTDPLDQRNDDVWEFEFVNNIGKPEKRTALLTCEKDVLWERFRHQHIQKVNELVSEEIEQIAGNAASGALGKTANTQEVLKAVRELPKTQYMVEKYWAHVALTERAFEQLETANLVKLGALEQAIATNTDTGGGKYSHTKALQQLANVLSDVEVLDELKARLILLYMAAYRNVTIKHVNELITAATIAPSYATIIQKFDELNLGPPPLEATTAASPRNAGQPPKIVHKHYEKGDAHAYYKKHGTATEYELSRYMPEIRHVIGRSIAGTLDKDRFPTLHTGTRETTGQKASNKRVMLYMIGGITFAEMRVVCDMAEKTGVDIYLGGDTIVVPSALMDNMKHAFSAMERT